MTDIASEQATTHSAYIADMVHFLIQTRPEHGALNGDCVLAMDILMHALKFCDVPDGLMIWREALWHRILPSPGRQAIVGMIDHIIAANDRGELNSAGKICNCLSAVMDPAVFRSVSQRRISSDQEGRS